MTSMTRHQLRAARALLVLQQEVLASKAGVGVATLRRFENGNEVGRDVVASIQAAIEREGAVLIPPGHAIDGLMADGVEVDGRTVGGGVVLRGADLPEATRDRLAALDRTSAQAAVDLPAAARDKPGRRSRVPTPSTLARRARKEAEARAASEEG